MEYKIGQRVRYKENGKEYYFNERKADGCYDLIDKNGNWAATIFPGATHLIEPLYKPGDQVRVISTEEELADIALDGVVNEGSIIVVEGYIEGGWIKFDGWSINIKYVEWYSGVEDKLEIKVDLAKSRSEKTLIYSTPRQQGKSFYQKWWDEACKVDPKDLELLKIPDKDRQKLLYGEWLPEAKQKEIAEVWQDELVPVDFLPAEVHQDKDRNRAALAEVLKIKEPTTNKWMCPKCRFTGSIHDIRQHCVVAHGESLPPPESKSYWETWRVS